MGLGVRGVVGSWGRACAGACAACEPSRVQGAVMTACLNVCGLKVKANVGAWAVCSAVTCGAWRALVRREPGQGDVAGDGTLELWSLCGWAQITGSRWLSGFYGSYGVRIDAVGARCVRAASSVHARVRAVLSRSGQHREDGRRHFCNNFSSKVCLSVCLSVVCFQ